MDGFKQRIIGAIVLISLAVIFVPMLFDEPHTERTSQAIDLPEEPAFPKVDVDQADMATQKPADSAPGYRLEEKGGENTAGSSLTGSSSDTAGMSPTTVTDDTSAREMSSASMPDKSQSATKQTQSEPQKPQSASPKSASDTVADSDESAGGTTDSVEPKEFSQSLEGAWLVQLGSFGNESNAQRLRDSVRKSGYAAHTQTVKRGDKNLTRVFSGPYAAKSDANDAKKVLDKAFSVNSLVMAGDK